MSDLKLAIFDVDGTLIDSQAHIMAAMVAAFREQEMPEPSRRAVMRLVGLSLPIIMAKLAPDATPAVQAALVDQYKTQFMTMRQQGGASLSPLFPGARQVLDSLVQRDDVLLAVATGKSRRGMTHLIEMNDLEGIFSSVQVSDNHPSKPSPSMVLTCLEETGVDARQAIILGDTSFDMQMGKNAGVRGLGVAWGYHAPAELREAGAADVLESFDVLIPALDQMWSVT